MDEPDFDAGKFFILNPVWHVLNAKTFDVAGGDACDGGRYAVAFTDKDLAERFIVGSGILNAMPVEFALPDVWIAFLEGLADVGYEYVVVDPEPGQVMRISGIQTVIGKYRSESGWPTGD